MNILSITLLFVIVQILITVAKIVAEVLFLDEEFAFYGEFAASSVLGVVYYFVLLPRGESPVVCWFLASVFSVVALIVSWGLPKIFDYFLGWGEDDIPLPVFFPVLSTWVLFLCFLPTGFGKTIGIPNLFAGKVTFFIVIAFTQLVTAGITLFISHYFEDENATLAIDGIFSIGIAILTWSLLNEQMSSSYATFLSFIIIIAINIELVGIFYFCGQYLEIIEVDDSFWISRRYIFSGQVIAIVILYFFPVLHTILSLIDRVTS